MTPDDQTPPGLDRRLLFGLAAAGAAGLATSPAAAKLRARPLAEQWVEPPQVPVTEGLTDVGGAKLWWWDTGGRGEVVILLHPATGSGATWVYQQPVFAKAGYRVIGYSRRGHYKSESGPADKTGTVAGDLHALVEALKVDRFHMIGAAAGGFACADYALSHPDRLISFIIACSLGGVADPEYSKVSAALRPPNFDELPATFRELGPSYRAANPKGTERWAALEAAARTGARLRQPAINTLNWANIGKIKTPCLYVTGAADLYMPPSRLADWTRRLPIIETAVIPEAGHSAPWEQPDAFNGVALDFLKRHKARRRPR